MADQQSISTHPSDDLLELYALNRLDPVELEQVEVHLLLCTECQECVEEIDAFIAATRHAAAELPQKKLKRTSSPGWAGLFSFPLRAAGVVVVALLVVVTTLTWRRDERPQPVDLAALRGGASPALVNTTNPVRINLDVTDLSGTSPSFTLELVDASGIAKWNENDLIPDGTRLSATVPNALSPGQYFIRLYANAMKNEVLREYSLVAK